MIRRPPRSTLFPYTRSSDLGAPPGTRLIWATAESGQYPVYVGGGLIDARFRAIEGQGVVVTDSNRSEEHTSELQSHVNLVCRLLLEKKKKKKTKTNESMLDD